MAQMLIRNIDPKAVERLKRQAKAHGRSLQAEARTILESNAKMTHEESLAWVEEFRKRFKGRVFPDSVDLIREDRNR